jgi:hypothetical protein
MNDICLELFWFTRGWQALTGNDSSSSLDSYREEKVTFNGCSSVEWNMHYLHSTECS